MAGTPRALLALLLLGLLLLQPAAASPAAQPSPAIGPVTLVGLDARGDGWAIAREIAQEGDDSFEIGAARFLLRIENGKWRVAADSGSNPELLTGNVVMHAIALTAAGDGGWAIGSDRDAAEAVLWRLQQGTWRRVRMELPEGVRGFSSITMSEDGADGWLAVDDPSRYAAYLWRLRNGSWSPVDLPEGKVLDPIAISPNGRHGWAISYDGREHLLFRLLDGRWVRQDGVSPPAELFPLGIAVDNSGAGWASLRWSEAFSEKREQAFLVRLSRDGKVGKPVEIKPPASQEANPELSVGLPGPALDRMGRGWLAANFYVLKNTTPPFEFDNFPVLLRLSGDSAVEVPLSSAGPIASDDSLEALAVSYDGGHAWIGGGHEQSGMLVELREPWRHDSPAATAPLPGAAVCFAEVPNCLRGSFATYWQSNGGLERFGYPITPEVAESHGGKDYRVQYTERARFEDHPENAGTPHEVLLGLLGNTLADPRAGEQAFKPVEPRDCASCEWFRQTGHNVAPPFAGYWRNNGGVAVFGLPRSEAFDEKNAADGKVYRVQYFERNRLEHHPENRGTKFEFQLGLLGVEQFTKTYGYTP